MWWLPENVKGLRSADWCLAKASITEVPADLRTLTIPSILIQTPSVKTLSGFLLSKALTLAPINTVKTGYWLFFSKVFCAISFILFSRQKSDFVPAADFVDNITPVVRFAVSDCRCLGQLQCLAASRFFASNVQVSRNPPSAEIAVFCDFNLILYAIVI